MAKQSNLVDRTFDKLTVKAQVPRPANVTGSGRYWLCVCECGAERVVRTSKLLSHETKSCGCVKTIHGLWDARVYKIYMHMLQRCCNSNNDAWHLYGGRGITVCDRWRAEHGFVDFLKDMGEPPTTKHSLDRYPNRDGNYEPDNCRWATVEEQQNNRRNCVYIAHLGRTQTLAQWCRELWLNRSSVSYRLGMGYTVELAFAESQILPRPPHLIPLAFGG
jgi:hypothetical protein